MTLAKVISPLTSAIALMLLVLACAPAAALTVTATGSASVSQGDMPAARTAALSEALREAGKRAREGSASRYGMPKDDQAAPQAPVRYTVLREWTAGKRFNVEIEAEFEGPQECAGGSGKRYRKSVATAYFVVYRPEQINDIDDMQYGIPNELLRSLESSTGLLPTAASRLNPFRQPNPETHFEADPRLIKRIAALENSQFVIAGRVLDAGVSAVGYRPWYGWSDVEGNEQRVGVVLPNTMLGAGVMQVPTERRIDIEALVYDGASGELIARHRVDGIASGKVMVGRDHPFGSSGFYATDFGVLLKKSIAELAQRIEQSLQCLPFTASLIRVDGTSVQVAAGQGAGLHEGDRFKVYRRKPGQPAIVPGSNLVLGIPEVAAGRVVIRQVEPGFSSGTLENASGRVQEGDLLRPE